MVCPSAPRVGLQLHGWIGPHPHGSSLHVRSLQFSARTDLDYRGAASADDSRMAFTGQIMRFDQDAYWGLEIGASAVVRVPSVGPQVVHLTLGDRSSPAKRYFVFFAIHVFLFPGALIGFVGLHVLMAETRNQ